MTAMSSQRAGCVNMIYTCAAGHHSLCDVQPLLQSPRDKLVCILNCCKVINNLLASRRYGAGLSCDRLSRIAGGSISAA